MSSALFRHQRCQNSECSLLPGELVKSLLLVVAFCVPQPWQQAALWEGRNCRTKASKALLRISAALMSHVGSAHPYFVASLHYLSFLLPLPEQVGLKSGFLSLAIMVLLNDSTAPHHMRVPSSFLLFLISCVLSPVLPPLSYLLIPVSIPLALQ